MKKKIVTCSLVVALLVIGVIGASLAYFTDTDNADNVFTTGNVKIELNEQQRNDKGDALEAFEQNKVSSTRSLAQHRARKTSSECLPQRTM